MKPSRTSSISILSLLLIFLNLIFNSPTVLAHGVEKLTNEEFEKKLPSLTIDIKNANTYSWGVVGTPSAMTRAENAARILHSNADKNTLSSLLNGATTEGQMYVLCVLKRKYPFQYLKEIKKINYETGQVSIFTGSVLSKSSAKNILKQIEKYKCSPLDWKN